jgi:hypothetical protein
MDVVAGKLRNTLYKQMGIDQKSISGFWEINKGKK